MAPKSFLGGVRRARHRRVRPYVALTGVLGLVLAALANPATAAASQPTPPPGWKATQLKAGSMVHGAKSRSGQLAKSDAKLLARRDSKPVNVMVKLDYDALASYRGDLSGLPATSPAATKRSFNPKSDNVRRYESYVSGVENKFLSALRSRVPQAKAGKTFRLVYGGLPVTLPGNKAAELLKLPGVAAVQENKMAKPLTDSSPEFIGAPTIYNQLGGSNSSGKGVIVGVLDSGAWPEHPSYNDPGNLPAPPPTADGTPRTCDFGDNPQTPASDTFACNRKLISGQPFIDTYNAIVGGEVYPDTARDSDGHGTHTSTTSAGGAVANANPLGIDRGPIHGIAPAAHVAVYKVCGLEGCFNSDSVAAVQRAILDKVRVINFSISGGVDPYSDAVELAFLDAYAAGVLVSASAGNEGPGAATVNHNGPWVTTVAASTQTRTFQSQVTLTAGGATATLSGSSITRGISSPTPVILAADAPGYDDVNCDTPPPSPTTFAGKIVACQLPLAGRVIKGFNVFQGGAAGMLLYNQNLSQTMTDNHWLPTAHLEKPQADQLLAFLAAHPNNTSATLTQGAKTTWPGDVMTAFSSRGPGADFLKPDVTAPGLQILAGNTPTPDAREPALGPPGNLYQAIAGTSMSSPHVAGSAALLFALHPDWTPGQVKSALETTAKTSVVKHDRVTPADPFDFGGGRIDLTKAGDPGLTFDETAAKYVASAAQRPADRIDLNLPSVNAPTMPGAISTTRTAKNVTSRTLDYEVSTTAPKGASITVVPKSFSVKPGKTVKLNILISGIGLANGQYFGQIRLDQQGGSRDLHLPVAFNRTQGGVTLAQTCDPATIARDTGRSTCSVTAQNTTLEDAQVTAASHLDSNLSLTSVTGAKKVGSRDALASAKLAARVPEEPNIAPGQGPSPYISLPDIGIEPFPVGDEDAVNLNLPDNGLPPFVFAGKSYDTIGLVSNGYSVAGGAADVDIAFEPQTLPDPARPNAELAPFWTDLDGTGAPGIYAAILSEEAPSTNSWLVFEWRVNIFGTTSQRVFQQWIGLNGTEDITYTYDPANLPAAPPAGFGLTVGAENDTGTAGNQIDGLPTEDLRVTSTPSAPGGTLSYSFQLKGLRTGPGNVTTVMSTPAVRGVTSEVDQVTVR